MLSSQHHPHQQAPLINQLSNYLTLQRRPFSSHQYHQQQHPNLTTMSTTAPTTPYNYSLQAIPAAFLFAIIPHGYGMARLMYETSNKSSIAMPRTNLDAWKSKLPAATWNHLARARGAHLNSLEVFPLFAAAVVSSLSSCSMLSMLD